MSTASTRAYVATIGLVARRRGSPSSSASCDSPIPVRRYVRDATSAPSPRPRRRGIASSVHIGRISRGGPGIATMTRPSGRVTNQPGAVPFGLASASDEGIRQACLRFSSEKPCRAVARVRAATPRRRIDRHGLAAGGGDRLAGEVVRRRPEAAGRDHEIGPGEGRAERFGHHRQIVRQRGQRPTRTPASVSVRASSPAFVSRVSPTVSSVPMLRSSAVRMRRAWGVDITAQRSVPSVAG